MGVLAGAVAVAYLVARLGQRWMARPRSEDVVALVATATVGASLVSIFVQSSSGADGTDFGASSVLLLSALAIPALLGSWVTKGRLLRAMACVLAVMAWLPVGLAGDLTCTDCGFALLIPVTLALPQSALMVASVVARRSARP